MPTREPPAELAGGLLHKTMIRSCPVCRGNEYNIVYGGDSIPNRSGLSTSDLGLVMCKHCGTIFVNPAPRPENLISYYPIDYYAEDTGNHPKFIDKLNGAQSELARQTRRWLAETKYRTDPRSGRVLEVGCARGENLIPFIRAGWKAHAIEPNPTLARIAETHGVDVHVGLSDSFHWDAERFDVVILSHVLEHDHNPRMIVENCVRALRFGGLLYVEIPVTQTPSWKLFGRYWGELEFPIHLTLIRKEHLIEVIKRLGCLPLSCRTKTLMGSSLRSIEKIPQFSGVTGSQRMILLGFAAALQGLLTVINTAVGQGEAFSIVARRELA